MLREFNTVPYVPILSVRPAEMNALAELPEKDKEALLPCILLRGWVGAHKIDNALDKIKDAYGNRPWVIDLDPNFHPKGEIRAVHKTMASLKVSKGGYANWCNFVGKLPNAIPCLQIEDLDELGQQLVTFVALGRGIALRIPMDIQHDFDAILAVLKPVQGLRPLVILDYGQSNRDLLGRALNAIEVVRKISRNIPDASIVASATSFPSSFVGVEEQDIFERQFFNQVKDRCNGVNLIYGDRGSARAKPLGGGGGTPAARVDFPLSDKWKFYRVDTSPPTGYFEAAKELLKDKSVWKDLRLWGTNQIILAAKNDDFAIRSPVRATAVRINIHLHTQLHYGEPSAALIDTDDEWVD